MKLELQKHPTDIDLQSYQYIQLKGLLKYDVSPFLARNSEIPTEFYFCYT